MAIYRERTISKECSCSDVILQSSDASSKVRILSINMEQNDASMKAEDLEFRNHVNQFMLNLVDQTQIENELFQGSIIMVAQ
jgi:hypothetical protein